MNLVYSILFVLKGDNKEGDERMDETENKEYGARTGRKNPRGTIQFLNIIGQIEGHVILPAQNKSTKYEHVIPQLFITAEDPEIDGLLILLNTMGGDVEAGLALAEVIAGLGKPTVSLVVGGGHSIGVPLACAADVSFMGRCFVW